MIITLRGTSGSGKSTIVRNVMRNYETGTPVFVTGRKQPMYYILSHPGRKSLIVMGHYETACGGCDTLNGLDMIFDHVRKFDSEGFNVLFEGLIVSSDYKRTVELHTEGRDIHVIQLSTDVEECIRCVNERRRRKDPEKVDVNPRNTESKYKGTKRIFQRYEEAGLKCHTMAREEAFYFIMEKFSAEVRFENGK